MFQLIVSVLGIALAAVLALTGLFYAGSAFAGAAIRAQAAQVANAGEQIAAAILLQRQEGLALPATTADLVASKHLSSVPARIIRAPISTMSFANGPSSRVVDHADGNWQIGGPFYISGSSPEMSFGGARSVVTITVKRDLCLRLNGTTSEPALSIAADGKSGCYALAFKEGSTPHLPLYEGEQAYVYVRFAD